MPPNYPDNAKRLKRRSTLGLPITNLLLAGPDSNLIMLAGDIGSAPFESREHKASPHEIKPEVMPRMDSQRRSPEVGLGEMSCHGVPFALPISLKRFGPTSGCCQ